MRDAFGVQKVSNFANFQKPTKSFVRDAFGVQKVSNFANFREPKKSFVNDAFGVQKVSCTMQSFVHDAKFRAPKNSFRARCIWRAKSFVRDAFWRAKICTKSDFYSHT